MIESVLRRGASVAFHAFRSRDFVTADGNRHVRVRELFIHVFAKVALSL